MREMLLENPDFLVRVRCRSSEFVRESLNVEGAPPQQVGDSIAEEFSNGTEGLSEAPISLGAQAASTSAAAGFRSQAKLDLKYRKGKAGNDGSLD